MNLASAEPSTCGWRRIHRRTNRGSLAAAVHPRHLTGVALTAFLLEKLGLQESLSAVVEQTLTTKYFLLPTSEHMPSPSFELLRYVDEAEPIDFELAAWQVCCYRVPDIISALNDIHFIALRGAEDFQLGADLLFWYQYSQVIKGIIAKDQYIPALKYQEIAAAPSKGKKAKARNTPRFEIHAGWELLSESYETAIQRYVAAMPGVCVAGLNSPVDAALFDKESLLRHFSECLLHDIVTGTPFTGKFDQQIADTLLYKCIYPYRPTLTQSIDKEEELEDYKHWLAWRKNFTRAHTEDGFTLCFRLQEAAHDDIDNWHLHFLVASRRDPSLKLELDDYWQLNAQARAEAMQHFGQDFEKNLLLALGYAARIYGKLWDGMATDRPTGCQSDHGRGIRVLEGKRLGAGGRGLHRHRPGVVDAAGTPPHQSASQNKLCARPKGQRRSVRAISPSDRLSATSTSCRLAARPSPRRNGSSS